MAEKVYVLNVNSFSSRSIQLSCVVMSIFSLLPFFASGQSKDSVITDTINNIYLSESSVFVFDLKKIPSGVINVILNANDSINYLAGKEKTRTRLRTFIANTYEEWNSTDIVHGDELPWRQFIFAVNQGTKWVLIYEHVAFASHYHVLYMDTRFPDKLSTAATLMNSRQIDNLVFNKKVNEITSRTFKAIVKADEFQMLDGKVIFDYDTF